MSESNGTTDPADAMTVAPAPDTTPAPGHSPAPWREVGLEILDADGHAIATVWRSAAIDLGVSSTNARVMKAAPDLLAACRAVIFALETFGSDPRLLLHLQVEQLPKLKAAAALATA